MRKEKDGNLRWSLPEAEEDTGKGLDAWMYVKYVCISCGEQSDDDAGVDDDDDDDGFDIIDDNFNDDLVIDSYCLQDGGGGGGGGGGGWGQTDALGEAADLGEGEEG